MRRIKLLVVIFVLGFTASAYAADHSAKTFNVRVNALPLIIGYINADLDVGISDGFTVGPSGTLWSLSSGDISYTILGFGVRGNYFFNGKRYTDGFYAGPFANYMSTSGKTTSAGVEYTATIGTIKGGLLLGYHWIWDAGFNMQLGLGGAYSSTGDAVTYKSSTGATKSVSTASSLKGFGPAFEWTLGFVF
ncbi:MAG: DUF3575 domain-containing protein [Bdellovibrio sp.]|nr:DUF3575 domain-containing protein [Bdellovibrio sp.]